MLRLEMGMSFLKILVTGNHDRKFLILFQNLRSELVYIVLYDQNQLLNLNRNQICVIWTQHWSFATVNVMLTGVLDIFWGKNSHSYRPIGAIGEMEGTVQETNIFLRVASSVDHFVIKKKWKQYTYNFNTIFHEY